MATYRVWQVVEAKSKRAATAKAKKDNHWTVAELCMRDFMAGTICGLGKGHDRSHDDPPLREGDE